MTAKSKNTEPEFAEPVVAKKKRPVCTPVAVYADVPGQEAPAKTLAEMDEVDARMWLASGEKKPTSVKVSPQLKEAFKQAAAIKGYGTVNNAINTVMIDLVMECREQIKLNV